MRLALIFAALAPSSITAAPVNVANWSLDGPWGAANIDTFSGLAFESGALYVSAKGVNQFLRLSGATGKITANATLPTPHGCAAAAGKMFVGVPYALYALDLRTLETLARVETVGDTEYIRVSADGATVYASIGEDFPPPNGDAGWSVVGAFDSETVLLNSSTELPSKLEFFSLVPDGTRFVAAVPDTSNEVVVADSATRKIVRSIKVPKAGEPHVSIADRTGRIYVGGEPHALYVYDSTGNLIFTSVEPTNPGSWHDGVFDENSQTLFIAGGEGKEVGGIARYQVTADSTFGFLGVLRPAGRTFAIDGATQRLFTAVEAHSGEDAYVAVWQL